MNTDVIVIGAGVVGCAVARELGKRPFYISDFGVEFSRRL